MSQYRAALAAFISLAILGFSGLCRAQSGAVEPGSGGNAIEIDEHSGARQPEKPRSSDASSNGSKMVVPVGTQQDDVEVTDSTLIVRGIVHNLKAVNSDVIVEPSGKVEGSIEIVNGRMINAKENTRASRNEVPVPMGNRPISRVRFFAQQVGAFLIGMLGVGLILLITPNAVVAAVRKATTEPGRCFIAGAIAGFGLFVVSIIGAGLMHTPLRILWSPFYFVIATGSVLIYGYGWLCSCRLIGDWIVKKSGKTGSGEFASRIILGLFAACAVTALAGLISVSLGGMALTVQGVFSLIGVGALVLSKVSGEGGTR